MTFQRHTFFFSYEHVDQIHVLTLTAFITMLRWIQCNWFLCRRRWKSENILKPIGEWVSIERIIDINRGIVGFSLLASHFRKIEWWWRRNYFLRIDYIDSNNFIKDSLRFFPSIRIENSQNSTSINRIPSTAAIVYVQRSCLNWCMPKYIRTRQYFFHVIRFVCCSRSSCATYNFSPIKKRKTKFSIL